MIDFQLRHATQHDFDIIIRFVQAMQREMQMLSDLQLTDRAEAWLDFECRIWQTLRCDENGDPIDPCAADQLLEVAETIDASSPIGMIEASVMHPLPPFRPMQTLYIHAVYVLPPCRYQGVGTALLHAALDWGRHQHCQQAELCALPHNPARRLYQALGFSVTGLEMRLALA